MIHGETVYVIKNVVKSEDRFGNPTFKEERTKVDNVLVSVEQSTDFDEHGRFETSENSITLHFPKTFNKSLFGYDVDVRGERFKVVGNPMWYTPEDTPTLWNYPVKVVRADG